MIKIKDYIFNENEIRYIKYEENAIFIYLRFDISSFIRLENATFEDIEWNYEDEQIRKCLDSIDREKELEEENEKLKEVQCTFLGIGCKRRLQELEEENKKLKDELELKDFNYTKFRHLEESNDILKEELEEEENKIDKAIEYIEEKWYEKNTMDIYSVVSTGDIRIDILKILKGEE